MLKVLNFKSNLIL